MEYSRNDTELVRQPIGCRSRAALAGIGITQPQRWIRAQAVRAARADAVRTRDEVSRLPARQATAVRVLWSDVTSLRGAPLLAPLRLVTPCLRGRAAPWRRRGRRS
ncbi:hypothetical protein SUDANB126_06738 [Streptomyces sp. enrichment culture]